MTNSLRLSGERCKRPRPDQPALPGCSHLLLPSLSTGCVRKAQARWPGSGRGPWQRGWRETHVQKAKGWESRRAFTAASFPPGGWLCSLNLTSDDLCIPFLETVALPGAIELCLAFFSFLAGTSSQRSLSLFRQHPAFPPLPCRQGACC